MRNQPLKGTWLGSCDAFLHAQLWTLKIRKFRHDTPLTELSNAVDDGPVFITAMTVDVSDAIR